MGYAGESNKPVSFLLCIARTRTQAPIHPVRHACLYTGTREGGGAGTAAARRSSGKHFSIAEAAGMVKLRDALHHANAHGGAEPVGRVVALASRHAARRLAGTEVLRCWRSKEESIHASVGPRMMPLVPPA